MGLLREGASAADERRYSDVGMPTVRELIGECIALGVTVSACQSGLALAGMSVEDLPAGVDSGGLVAFLASQSDDQLLMA